MKEIEQALSEKLKQLEQVQREVDTLRSALQIVRDNSGRSPAPILPHSQPQMAVAILEAAGHPLHAKDIASQMRQRFGASVNKVNLGVLLYRYQQRGKHFYKVPGKPNTYGLLKWRPVASLRIGESKAVQ